MPKLAFDFTLQCRDESIAHRPDVKRWLEDVAAMVRADLECGPYIPLLHEAPSDGKFYHPRMVISGPTPVQHIIPNQNLHVADGQRVYEIIHHESIYP